MPFVQDLSQISELDYPSLPPCLCTSTIYLTALSGKAPAKGLQVSDGASTSLSKAALFFLLTFSKIRLVCDHSRNWVGVIYELSMGKRRFEQMGKELKHAG